MGVGSFLNGINWTGAGLMNTFIPCLAVSGMNLFAGTGNGV